MLYDGGQWGIFSYLQNICIVLWKKKNHETMHKVVVHDYSYFGCGASSFLMLSSFSASSSLPRPSSKIISSCVSYRKIVI